MPITTCGNINRSNYFIILIITKRVWYKQNRYIVIHPKKKKKNNNFFQIIEICRQRKHDGNGGVSLKMKLSRGFRQSPSFVAIIVAQTPGWSEACLVPGWISW